MSTVGFSASPFCSLLIASPHTLGSASRGGLKRRTPLSARRSRETDMALRLQISISQHCELNRCNTVAPPYFVCCGLRSLFIQIKCVVQNGIMQMHFAKRCIRRKNVRNCGERKKRGKTPSCASGIAKVSAIN